MDRTCDPCRVKAGDGHRTTCASLCGQPYCLAGIATARVQIAPELTHGAMLLKSATMYEKHGETTGKKVSRLYRIWVAMRQRCNDPNRDNYARYGGRGIKVCPEWDSSFPTFKTWALANGYSDKLSIDRIDVDKGYAPGNCRWATEKEQMANTSRACLVTIGGTTRTVAEWSAVTGITWSTLYKRYHRGVRGASLITKPAAVRKGSSL